MLQCNHVICSIDTLQKKLYKLITNTDLFYVFRIDAEFDYIKTRSVPKQVKPYPILSEVTKNQSIFEFHDVKGTVVVVWCPEYIGGVNVSGYHMHFISDDRTSEHPEEKIDIFTYNNPLIFLESLDKTGGLIGAFLLLNYILRKIMTFHVRSY